MIYIYEIRGVPSKPLFNDDKKSPSPLIIDRKNKIITDKYTVLPVFFEED